MKSGRYLIAFCLFAFIASEELLFEGFSDNSMVAQAEATIEKYDCHGADKYNTTVCPKAIVISNIASSIASTYGQIVNAIKTTTSKTLVEKFMREGFERLYLQSTVKVASGISDYEKYVKILRKYTVKDIPENFIEKFDEALEVLEISEEYKVSQINVAFEGERPENKISSLNIIGAKDSNDKKYLITAYMTTDFKFAPHLFIWRKSSSIAGGILDKTEDKIEKVPQTLTKDEISTMLNCFQWMAYKLMIEQMGIKGINTNEKF